MDLPLQISFSPSLSAIYTPSNFRPIAIIMVQPPPPLSPWDGKWDGKSLPPVQPGWTSLAEYSQHPLVVKPGDIAMLKVDENIPEGSPAKVLDVLLKTTGGSTPRHTYVLRVAWYYCPDDHAAVKAHFNHPDVAARTSLMDKPTAKIYVLSNVIDHQPTNFIVSVTTSLRIDPESMLVFEKRTSKAKTNEKVVPKDIIHGWNVTNPWWAGHFNTTPSSARVHGKIDSQLKDEKKDQRELRNKGADVSSKPSGSTSKPEPVQRTISSKDPMSSALSKPTAVPKKRSRPASEVTGEKSDTTPQVSRLGPTAVGLSVPPPRPRQSNVSRKVDPLSKPSTVISVNASDAKEDTYGNAHPNLLPTALGAGWVATSIGVPHKSSTSTTSIQGTKGHDMAAPAKDRSALLATSTALAKTLLKDDTNGTVTIRSAQATKDDAKHAYTKNPTMNNTPEEENPPAVKQPSKKRPADKQAGGDPSRPRFTDLGVAELQSENKRLRRLVEKAQSQGFLTKEEF